MNMSETRTILGQSISAHTAARFWQATLARDSRADGTFVLAVRSTHIYCRPSCPARRPLRRNVIFFRTREEAEKQGYRPCRRCRPNEIAGHVALVQRAALHLRESSEDGVRLGALARALGTTQGTLRRAFLQVTGLNPRRSVPKTLQDDASRGEEHNRCTLRDRIRIIQPRLRTQQRTTRNDAGNLSKGRPGYENRIHDREIATGESSCWRDRARHLGCLFGRRR